MDKSNKLILRINKICSLCFWIFTVLIPVHLGIYFYTKEYNGNTLYTLGGYKKILDTTVTLVFSRLMIYVIFSIIIILISGTGFYVSKYINEIQSDVRQYEKQINGLKDQLNNKINSNIEINDKTQVIDVMRKFCMNYIDIISIQLYECKETKNKNKITFEFIPNGYRYVNDNEVVNSIHEKYCVNQSSINQYLKVKKQYLEGDEKSLNEYIKKLIERLKKKENKKITDTTINDYCFLILSFQLIFKKEQFAIKDLSDKFQNEINNKKRTGFLRGIIEQGYYKFENTGDNYKSNRIYLTNCIDMKNVLHMCVITFKPEITRQLNYEDIIDNIGMKFYDILDKELKIVYNDYKIS